MNQDVLNTDAKGSRLLCFAHSGWLDSPLPLDLDSMREKHIAITMPEQDTLHLAIGRLEDIPSRGEGRRERQRAEVRNSLNNLLQSVYGSDAASWSLSSTDSGQPFLEGKNTPSISLAHADAWMACAACMNASVGIDIEPLKHRDWENLAPVAFHAMETTWIMQALAQERLLRGYIAWCRKEALLKAIGIGIRVPLNEIGFSPEGRLEYAPEENWIRQGWHTRTWFIDQNAIASVVWCSR